MDKNHSSPVELSPRLTSAVTTSALSLSLISCIPTSVPLNTTSNPTGPHATPAQGPVQYTDAQAFQKYANNGYNYVDAKVLAQFWGERSPSDAKVRLGHKMLHSGPSQGRAYVSDARNSALRRPVDQWPVWFEDGNYSYNDMERLGRYWGRGTWEAKVKVARQLIQGQDNWNRSALSNAIQTGV